MAQRGTDAAQGVVVEGTSGAETANSAGADVQDGGGIWNRFGPRKQQMPSGTRGPGGAETGNTGSQNNAGTDVPINRWQRLIQGKKNKDEKPWIDVNSDIHTKPGSEDLLEVGWGLRPVKIRIFGPPKPTQEEVGPSTDDSLQTKTSGLSGVSSVSRFQGVYGGDVFAQMGAELRLHGKIAVDDFRKLLKAVGDKAIKRENREALVLVEEANETLDAVNDLISK